jgi:hypothetical protein
MGDFKKGREMFKKIVTKMMNTKAFAPLAMSFFFRMSTYSQDVQTKIKESWSAD